MSEWTLENTKDSIIDGPKSRVSNFDGNANGRQDVVDDCDVVLRSAEGLSS